MNDQVAIQQAAQYGFDAGCYLTRYPDVAQNWPHAAATHYILYGMKEGRIPGCDPVTTNTQTGTTTNPNTIPTADQVSGGVPKTTTTQSTQVAQNTTGTTIPPPNKKINPWLIGGVAVGAVVVGVIIVKLIKK